MKSGKDIVLYLKNWSPDTSGAVFVHIHGPIEIRIGPDFVKKSEIGIVATKNHILLRVSPSRCEAKKPWQYDANIEPGFGKASQSQPKILVLSHRCVRSIMDHGFGVHHARSSRANHFSNTP